MQLAVLMLAVATLMMACAARIVVAAETSKAEWSQCKTHADCAVVKGPCAPAAANASYRRDAEIFYASLAKQQPCVKQFWQPTMENAAARCRLERCEIVVKENPNDSRH